MSVCGEYLCCVFSDMGESTLNTEGNVRGKGRGERWGKQVFWQRNATKQ